MKTLETLPVKHANRFEMDAFYKLCAMRNTLGMAKEDLESRARMITGAHDPWRVARSVRMLRAHGKAREPHAADL